MMQRLNVLFGAEFETALKSRTRHVLLTRRPTSIKNGLPGAEFELNETE
jgi:hypothetical protein